MPDWNEINWDKRRGWVYTLNPSVQIIVENLHHNKYKASLLVLDQTMLYNPNPTVLSKHIENNAHTIQNPDAIVSAARTMVPKLKSRYAAIKAIRDITMHRLTPDNFTTVTPDNFTTVTPDTTWLCHVNPTDSIILTKYTNRLYEIKYMNAFDGVIVSRAFKLAKKDKKLPLGQIMDKCLTEFADNTLDRVLQNLAVITKQLEALK